MTIEQLRKQKTRRALSIRQYRHPKDTYTKDKRKKGTKTQTQEISPDILKNQKEKL